MILLLLVLHVAHVRGTHATGSVGRATGSLSVLPVAEVPVPLLSNTSSSTTTSVGKPPWRQKTQAMMFGASLQTTRVWRRQPETELSGAAVARQWRQTRTT